MTEIALAAGIGRVAIFESLNGRSQMAAPSVRALAGLFGADPAEVLVLAGYPAADPRANTPGAFDSLGAWLDAACNARGVSRLAAARGAGVPDSTVQNIVQGRQSAEKETVRRLARFFRVDEKEALKLRPKPAGRVALAKRLAVERGHDWHVGIGLKAAKKTRKGSSYICVFCQDPHRKVFRKLSAYRKAQQRLVNREAEPCFYHRACYHEWLRTNHVELTGLARLRRRVKASGDVGLLEDIDERISANLQHLRTPNKADRPPTLLEDRDLATQMACLQHEGGLSAGRVAQLADLPTVRDASGVVKPGTRAKNLLRLGRALVGFKRLPPGPRQAA